MSNVQISEINGMKIYNLTGGKSLYDLMKESNFSIKKLKKNNEYQNHIEILQDCNFPVSSECIKLSQDQNYLFASGIYPPRLKIFDLNEMSLKCERGFDSQIRKIETISEDYKKLACLCDDRNIEFHAQYGKHFKIRIPKYGRDLKYDKIYCDLFSCGTGNEIYRLNLNQGQFLSSFETHSENVNCLGYNQPLELLSCGCENGICEIFDLRMKKNVFSFDDNYNKNEITAIEFNNNDGIHLAIGKKNGIVNIFDLRNPKPLFSINHNYKFPIKKIIFDEYSKNIITIDKKLAKFSNIKTGTNFTNIETKNEINDFELFKNSGMFFFACESEKIEIYFVPQIGPAPKWASFLDNITEELELVKNYNLFEDYKFLTLNEIEKLNCKNLIGTKMLKSYMHGYFMDWNLYKKLKNLNENYDYDEYLKEKKEEKIKKYFGDRIVFNKGNNKKVNEKLLNLKFDENINNNKKVFDVNDERFSKLFNDKNYEIDFNSEKFKKKNKNLIFDDDNNNNEIKNKNNNNENENENIVNKEIIKLNEKLLQKKREKSKKLKLNFNEENESDFNERLKNNFDENDEDIFEIQNKIKKLENKKEIQKNKKNKLNEKINLLKNKRIIANISQLNKNKFK